MKLKRLPVVLVLFVALLLAPLCATAQEEVAAVALDQVEIEDWLTALRTQVQAQQPLNTPVGRESHTPDGYAFLYDAFTLYYEQPDSSSPLLAVTLTEPGYPDPRQIAVGDDQAAVMAAYGEQNPELLGDDTLAALYRENDLPAEAGWAWAISSDTELLSVQCTLHAALEDGRYTDMGIRYQLSDGKVERIHLYGLANSTIEASAVLTNLEAVSQLMALADDNDPADICSQPSNAEPFGPSDLTFAGMDFLTMGDREVMALYGEPLFTDVLPDAEGLLYLTTERDGLSIGYLERMDGTMVQAQSVAITTPMIEGPRQLRVGMTLQEAVQQLYCDGKGQTIGEAYLLYGDGQSAPYGLMEPDGVGSVVLRYLCEAKGPNGLLTVTLYLTFQQDLLSEIYLYAW